MKFLTTFSALIFFSGIIAQAEVVQSGEYKIVSDTCYDRSGKPKQTCDSDWTTIVQEMQIALTQGVSPLDGSIRVVPTKQIVPTQIYNGIAYSVGDATVPSGFFSSNSVVEDDIITYVYENEAWVSNKYVGESEKGRFLYKFDNDKLTFTVFGISVSGLVDRKIRETTFQK